jgi:hypothetical protein
MQRCCRELMALLWTVALVPAHAASKPPKPHMHTLVVGWHDEFNSLEGWSPWTAFGGADILGGMDGTLRVTLGSTSMFMQEFGHYRAGVWKEVDVDLHRYPILAVRVLHFRNGSSWDVGVLEYRDKNAPDARDITHGGGVPIPGNAQGLAADQVATSNGRNHAETIFVNVQENAHRKPGKSHVRLLLNLSGPEQGAIVDYAWVRFIPRREVDWLRNNPTSERVRLMEP